MKIGFLQYDVIWRNREANLAYIEAKIKGVAFDLLVLPEMFTSGYAADTKEELLPFAEDLQDSPTVKHFAALMKESGGHIIGTLPEIAKGNLYNTSILVGPKGLIGSYRKIHVTDYEKRLFSPGNTVSVFDCSKFKIGLAICFDFWFAPLTSKLKIGGADIICHSACFSGEVTPSIVPIRALENQCYVVSCNRTGTELFDGEPDTYRGESQIVNPDGKVVAKADNKEALTILDIDLSKVNHPDFGSLITKDFPAQHAKYNIELKP